MLSTVLEDLDKASAMLSALDWSQWRAFDAELRERSLTAPVWFPGWWEISADAVPEYCRLSATSHLSAAVLSMHPNGHVREAAVRTLHQLCTPRAIPALVLRTTDWVGQVRRAAIEGLDQLRTQFGPVPFHDALPLMEAPPLADRARGTYLDQLRSWVLAGTTAVDLALLMTHADVRVRQASARVLAATGAAATGLDVALEQSDAATATIVVHGLTDADWQEVGVLESVLDSKFSGAATAALAQLTSVAPSRALELGRRGALSRSPTNRFLAQHFLRGHGVDLRSLYRTAFDSQPDIALAGLGEIGGPADVEIVEPYLDAPLPRVRAAAITALQRLAGRAAEATIASMLADPSPRVARAASWALIRLGPTAETVEHVWAIATSSPLGGRTAAFRLFASTGRWTALQVSCRALTSAEADIQACGQQLLVICMAKWNRSFTAPSAAERAALESALPPAMAELDPPTRELLVMSVKPYLTLPPND